MDITNIVLKRGSHKSPDGDVCLLEAVAYVAGLPHSDHPACTDPVLGAFGRVVNDFMTDDERELLVPLIPKLVDTAGDHTLSLRRAMLLCDGVVRQILPIVFYGINLPAVAKTLRDLAPVVDEVTARSAESAAWSAWSAGRSAGRSARSAARSAAESAARSAAESARSPADSAAWSARSACSAADSAARKSVINAVVQIFNAALEIK